MNELFNDICFKPFDIFEEYENLCEKISPHKQYRDLTLEQYGIVPTSWVDPSRFSSRLLHIEHFAGGLLICVKEIGNYNNNLINFKKELLTIELKWVVDFLSVIIKHLKNRNHQNETILKLSHIKQIIAEIVTDYEMAKMLLIDDEKHLNQASQFIISSCTKLMKLPGGRAFLKGSVLEMLWTFEALKNVYYHS